MKKSNNLWKYDNENPYNKIDWNENVTLSYSFFTLQKRTQKLSIFPIFDIQIATSKINVYTIWQNFAMNTKFEEINNNHNR